MASSVAVTVIGNDKPGIVAAVTRALFDLGCNLEDVSSTILRGHFSMTMIVSSPEPLVSAAIEEHLRKVANDLGLIVAVRPVDDAALDVAPPTHMVAVYGADKPGIVYRVTDALARLRVNITDLNSRLVGTDSEPVYALQIEVHSPSDVDIEKELPPMREELGVELSVHPIETDIL
jgi:glycine cleavage system transcriptional repressor